MIRGYRWKERGHQLYLVRTADGREVATVYAASSSWCWHVRGQFHWQHQSGFCDRMDDAKRAAEAKVKGANPEREWAA